MDFVNVIILWNCWAVILDETSIARTISVFCTVLPQLANKKNLINLTLSSFSIFLSINSFSANVVHAGHAIGVDFSQANSSKMQNKMLKEEEICYKMVYI